MAIYMTNYFKNKENLLTQLKNLCLSVLIIIKKIGFILILQTIRYLKKQRQSRKKFRMVDISIMRKNVDR
jgi:hypothetical protein